MAKSPDALWRALAGRLFQNERRDHTLQPTALVNELYLRFADQRKVQWHSRAELFAADLRRHLFFAGSLWHLEKVEDMADGAGREASFILSPRARCAKLPEVEVRRGPVGVS